MKKWFAAVLLAALVLTGCGPKQPEAHEAQLFAMDTLMSLRIWGMFDALRPDCLFSKIVEWRSTDLSQVKDPKEKKFIQEMKQIYRLRKSVDEQEKLDLIADALMGGGDLSKL